MTTYNDTKPLECQRDLFTLEADNGFINCAYMSPQMKAVYAAGCHALLLKNNPARVKPIDFFTTGEQVRKLFAQLVDCPDYERIALIASTSYGVATVANNLKLKAGQNIIVVADQFPSNYYSWYEKCKAAGAELRVVDCPETGPDDRWSIAIEEAIDENTALLALSAVHWADGTLWDLPALRKRTLEVGAWLVIDGTQSIGALPFSVREIQPDALITSGYKWLMGPYSTAYAYYGPVLDGGQPIEDNWINRKDSEDFKNLVNYQEAYRPKAGRYNVGQQSDFMGLPMQEAALQQLNVWRPERIQEYCAGLWSEIEPGLNELGIELPQRRAHHLVGIRLPKHLNTTCLPDELAKRKLTISFRGDAIRVAPNVYNRKDEMQRLLDALCAVN